MKHWKILICIEKNLSWKYTLVKIPDYYKTCLIKIKYTKTGICLSLCKLSRNQPAVDLHTVSVHCRLCKRSLHIPHTRLPLYNTYTLNIHYIIIQIYEKLLMHSLAMLARLSGWFAVQKLQSATQVCFSNIWSKWTDTVCAYFQLDVQGWQFKFAIKNNNKAKQQLRSKGRSICTSGLGKALKTRILLVFNFFLYCS